jgi:hypothetical protein
MFSGLGFRVSVAQSFCDFLVGRYRDSPSVTLLGQVSPIPLLVQTLMKAVIETSMQHVQIGSARYCPDLRRCVNFKKAHNDMPALTRSLFRKLSAWIGIWQAFFGGQLRVELLWKNRTKKMVTNMNR